MSNKYNKPWRVEYHTHNWKEESLPKPHEVACIRDCFDIKIVETDMGAYGPDATTAEYIVKCVNEREN
jgi:hypothetical protein